MSDLPKPEAVVAWLRAWWERGPEWRAEQRCACDVAHLLRGVADMIEGGGSGEHVCAFNRLADDRCAVCGVDLTHSTGRRNWRPT